MYISEYRVSGDILIIDVKPETRFLQLKNEITEKCDELSRAFRRGSCEEIIFANVSFSDSELDELEDIIYDRVDRMIATAKVGRKYSPEENPVTQMKGLARPFDELSTKRLFERATAPAVRREYEISHRREKPEIEQTEEKERESYDMFKKGSMRSGQKLEAKGSVVVFGDVNPGAEIRAGENIVVLGKLKGVARAGMNGNNESYVVAMELNPEQLIITNIVADFQRPSGFRFGAKKQKAVVPEYAHISGEQIYIDPIV